MVVLRPGDRVLIALAAEASPQEVTAMAAALRESFPGVEFTVMDGIQSIMVGGP
jgi:hypothetical protein